MRERKVLIATTNARKGEEMRQILEGAGLNLEFVTLADFPSSEEVEETGETFLENAHLKADAGARHSGLVTIADDGGLCINALDGHPGVKSHRFLGESTSFQVKMAHILEVMRDLPPERRACRFQCAVVIADPDGPIVECLGVCEGRIGETIKGTYGFGYDPIVYLPEIGKHMAELPPDQKHIISHRGKALACAIEALRRLYS